MAGEYPIDSFVPKNGGDEKISKFKVTERYGWKDGVWPGVPTPTISPFPTIPPSSPTLPPSSPVSVYVRVRPLVEEEVEAGEGMMPGIAMTNSDPADTNAIALTTETSTFRGFTGVLGPDADNKMVFQRCFESRLDTVVKGGTASLFCYGYTGSGKSHTVLGYEAEKGLYQQAAESLLDRIEETYPGDGLFLVATACEIYGDNVFDLMGEEKLPATLRTGENGNVCVCGPAVRSELSDLVEGFHQNKTAEDHATLVTRSIGLRCGIVKTKDDLDAIKTKALQLRAVGSSTEHNQSSRSHAVLRMEIMNKEMFEAREAAEEARALIPPLLNAIENHFKECLTQLVDQKDIGLTFGLKQFEGGQEEWDKTRAELVLKKEQLEKVVGQDSPLVARIEAAYQKLRDVPVHEAVGGAFVLVDLAGADYDKRDLGTATTPQQRKESTDINKSLLALKECFRSIASNTKPNFRGSKMTRLLEDSLLPGKQSDRRNRSSESVMVVNVSPAEQIAKRTMNVLRYGQIFADGTKKQKQDKNKIMKKKIEAAKKELNSEI